MNTFLDCRQLAEYTRGIPDYNFQVGDIRFIRAKKKKEAEKENEEDFKAFEGTGQSLRQAKKKWFEKLDYANYVRWSNVQNLQNRPKVAVISCITQYELPLPKNNSWQIANRIAIACMSELASQNTSVLSV